MVNAVLLDLDGTLTDSFPGIANSYEYALGKLGLPVPAREALLPFMGPPLREGFRWLGVDDTDMERAIAVYREYYAASGMYENALYPGVPEMLEALKANRKRIVLATSKATHYAEIILKHFEILPYFEFVSGADMDGTRSGKAEVIAHALETCQINPETAAMAGDRKMDILGALACGATPIAVLYGYGSREELTAAGATVFADTTDDILKLVL